MAGDQQRFDTEAVTHAASDTLTVRRVFGEAYEREGVLVVPVARVLGGTGGGAGTGEMDGSLPGKETRGHSTGAGGGGGFAARVKPLGVFVIDGTGVQWRPALDLNRVILGGQVVGAVAVLAIAWASRRRRR